MRRAPVLLLLSLLLAGCATDHDGHGRGLALLFGAKNGTGAPLEVGWTVSALAQNATVVWNRVESLDVDGVVERIEPLETEGEHRIDLSWGEGFSQPFSYDTEDCGGTFHLVIALAPDGIATEDTRECHE